MLTHRASRLTKRASAAAKPEGAGGFAPMPSASGSTVPTGTPFARTLGLVANSPRQNVSIQEDHALAVDPAVFGLQAVLDLVLGGEHGFNEAALLGGLDQAQPVRNR